MKLLRLQYISLSILLLVLCLGVMGMYHDSHKTALFQQIPYSGDRTEGETWVLKPQIFANHWQGYLPRGATLTVAAGSLGARICLYHITLNQEADFERRLKSGGWEYLGPYEDPIFASVKPLTEGCTGDFQ